MTSFWPAATATVASLDDVGDVTITTPVSGDFLVFDGVVWKNVTAGLDTLNDVSITSAADRNWLEFDSGAGQWVNRPSVVTETGTPTGFPNRTDTTVTFNSGTRTVTVAKTGADFKLWYYGRRAVKSANESVVIPNATALYFVTYDSSFAIQQSTTPFNFETQIPTSIVYWNATTGDYFVGEERHGTKRNLAWHTAKHNTQGAQFSSGGGASGYTLNSSLLADVQIAISGTVFYDEDIDNRPLARLKADTWDKWYFTLTGWRKHTDNNLLGSNATVANFFGASPLLAYNNISAGTIVETTNPTYFVNTFVFATNSLESANRFIVIPGQAEFSSSSAAYAETLDTLTLGGFPFVECVPLYQITWERRTINTGARINRVLSIRGARNPGVQTSVVNNHNALAGLEGGAPGQYYHFDATQYADLSNQSANLKTTGNPTFASVLTGTVNPSALGTLNLGTANASVINIGQAGVTTNINLYGTLSTIYTTDTDVAGELNLNGALEFVANGTAAANKIARTASGIDINNGVVIGTNTITFSSTTGTPAAGAIARTANGIAINGTFTVDTNRVFFSGTNGTPVYGGIANTLQGINMSNGAGIFAVTFLCDAIDEKTTANGVRVDGIILKDNTVCLNSSTALILGACANSTSVEIGKSGAATTVKGSFQVDQAATLGAATASSTLQHNIFGQESTLAAYNAALRVKSNAYSTTPTPDDVSFNVILDRASSTIFLTANDAGSLGCSIAIGSFTTETARFFANGSFGAGLSSGTTEHSHFLTAYRTGSTFALDVNNRYDSGGRGMRVSAGRSNTTDRTFVASDYANSVENVVCYSNGQISIRTTNWGTGGTAVGVNGGFFTLTPSSIRYKENVRDHQIDTSKIYQVVVREFDYRKQNGGAHDFGPIAEEVEPILPEIVWKENGVPESIRESKVIWILLEEMKKMRTELDQVKAMAS